MVPLFGGVKCPAYFLIQEVTIHRYLKFALKSFYF